MAKKKDDVSIEKPFPDEKNRFKWWIKYEQRDAFGGGKTGEVVVAYFLSEVDYEKGLERYGANILSSGIYDR